MEVVLSALTIGNISLFKSYNLSPSNANSFLLSVIISLINRSPVEEYVILESLSDIREFELIIANNFLVYFHIIS